MLFSTLDISLLNDVNYNEVTEDSALTVRKNNNQTLFIIGFPANKIPSIAEKEDHYTNQEMLDIIADPANGWVEENIYIIFAFMNWYQTTTYTGEVKYVQSST